MPQVNLKLWGPVYCSHPLCSACMHYQATSLSKGSKSLSPKSFNPCK